MNLKLVMVLVVVFQNQITFADTDPDTQISQFATTAQEMDQLKKASQNLKDKLKVKLRNLNKEKAKIKVIKIPTHDIQYHYVVQDSHRLGMKEFKTNQKKEIEKKLDQDFQKLEEIEKEMALVKSQLNELEMTDKNFSPAYKQARVVLNLVGKVETNRGRVFNISYQALFEGRGLFLAQSRSDRLNTKIEKDTEKLLKEGENLTDIVNKASQSQDPKIAKWIVKESFKESPPIEIIEKNSKQIHSSGAISY